MGENLLINSKRYRQFVDDRDRALERIHQHAQMDIAQHMKDFFEQTEMVVSYLSLRNSSSLINFQHNSSALEQGMVQNLKLIFGSILGRIHRMRQAVYILTYASEAEAIGQATQLKAHTTITSQDIHETVHAPTLSGDALDKRVWFNLMNLKAKILRAYELAMIQELSPEETLQKVSDSFPPLQVYTRAPRALKKAREASYNLLDDENGNSKADFSNTILSDSDWDMMVDAYKNTELPASRFEPGSAFDDETGTFKYNWELEQELTDDFVNQVRNGQVNAANDLGIEEFVWIAVIDDKTCDECCLPRNGKTTGEIQEMLDNGELDEDACDAEVPPAHPHCRCNIGPVASTDEVQGADFKAFGEWLNS